MVAAQGQIKAGAWLRSSCVFPMQDTMDDVDVEALSVCALEWMADTGHLGWLREQCERHREEGNIGAAYKFVLHLAPCELLQYSALLGSAVLHRPRVAWRAFQQVCYTAICTLGWLPALHTPSQVLLLLRLSFLPDLPGYTIDHASDFPPLTMEPRFYLISGVVCSMSIKEKYTQSACFYCPREGCEGGGEGSRYIRLHVAGATESATIRNDFVCSHCGTALLEDVAFRTLADKVVVSLVSSPALQMAQAVMLPSLQQRYQAITVIVRDELCEDVRMGGEYSVIGIPVHTLTESSTHTQVTTMVEANNIFPRDSRAGCEGRLPHSILEIYQACQYSPWAFSATLAYSFAAEIAPPGAYHRLKLAMLLSLVSASQNTDPRSSLLDLLAVGSDIPLLLQLLTYGSSFAQRSVLHSSAGDLCGSTRKEASGCFMDGGSLVLAEGGVCLVGNISHFKKDTKDKLQQMLETGQVTLSLPKRLGLEETQQLSWQLRCTLWACSDQQQRSRAFNRADVDIIRAHTMHETSAITKAFADRIGLVVVSDAVGSEMEDHLTEVLTDHILGNATGTKTSLLLSQEDFREFLLVSSALPVSLTPAAQQLLKAFYLASRRVRVSNLYSTDIPVSALDSMSSVATAHARLSLRQEVSEEDAIMAILLYEESLASRFGYSVLSLVPAPHFKDGNIGAYIGREFDKHMRQLHAQVLQFCKCHTPCPLGLEPEE